MCRTVNAALASYGCKHQKINCGRMVRTTIYNLLGALTSQFFIVHASKATPLGPYNGEHHFDPS